MEAMKVVTKVERKPIMKVELNDRAIEKLKVADFNFTYVAKDGSTKTKDRIILPIKTNKKTSLKGLKLTIHRSTGSKIFMIKYKFQTMFLKDKLSTQIKNLDSWIMEFTRLSRFRGLNGK